VRGDQRRPVGDRGRAKTWLGSALAIGDFNADGAIDLAIGSTRGALDVLYGSPDGLRVSGSLTNVRREVGRSRGRYGTP
jgi:hypothetical protein